MIFNKSKKQNLEPVRIMHLCNTSYCVITTLILKIDFEIKFVVSILAHKNIVLRFFFSKNRYLVYKIVIL